MGRLLSTLKELKLDENTLVVVVGDHGEGKGQHGEGKGQHGEHTHGPFVYDTTMSAPLMVRRPNGVGAGRRISAQVRSVDVAPTILSWAKLPLLPGAGGVDLSPLMAGATGDLGLAAYGESFHPRFSYQPVVEVCGSGFSPPSTSGFPANDRLESRSPKQKSFSPRTAMGTHNFACCARGVGSTFTRP